MSLRGINLRYLSRFSCDIPVAGVIVPVSTTKSVQFITSSSISTSPSAYSVKRRLDWNEAVSEAEKIVGYPTSSLGLRKLLSDEIANVTLQLRKLVGSNHPLLKAGKTLIYNGRKDIQATGLIVLLISKAAGHKNVEDMKEDKTAGILSSQRALAEVAEMIRTSHLVHKGLVNIYPAEFTEPGQLSGMNEGNKIALLSGDYLLSISSAALGALRNQDVVQLMSSAGRDQILSEFLGERDMQNNPLPSAGGESARANWTQRSVLSVGSLLGKSCQASLNLAGHTPRLQEEGYKFGKHLALAWQACLELEPFIRPHYLPGSAFSLTSAPILFHLENDPSLHVEIEKGLDSIHNIDYAKVYQLVSKGPGIVLTKQLQQEHSQKALEALSVFQENDARKALTNIIYALGEL